MIVSRISKKLPRIILRKFTINNMEMILFQYKKKALEKFSSDDIADNLLATGGKVFCLTRLV